jgi:transposase
MPRERVQSTDPSKGGEGFPEWARVRILAWFDQGVGNITQRAAIIKQYFGVSERTLRNWRQRLASTGNVNRLPASGGPPRLISTSHEVWLAAYLRTSLPCVHCAQDCVLWLPPWPLYPCCRIVTVRRTDFSLTRADRSWVRVLSCVSACSRVPRYDPG